jgi:hypothetical protein
MASDGTTNYQNAIMNPNKASKKGDFKNCPFASAMFAAGRKAVIASLSKGLSEKEFKKQLYYRTNGEHLPDDFFKH